nr:flagellar basal-body MS-ring/collar protein FliF [Enterococcus cecorum]
MASRFQENIERIKTSWSNLSTLLKRAIILGSISVLIVLGVSLYLMNKVSYGVLFADLSEADAGTITADLKSKNIDYKLQDGGKTILIDQSKIDEYRISLAVDNKLPDSSTGFELFDQAGMMTTDEDRKIMYQRALTGELQRSISSLSDVQKAKVILVLPDEGVFKDQKDNASASVVLTLKGSSISQEAVQGIVALTTASVKNLSSENVKVVDSKGNVLADGSKSSVSSSGISQHTLDMQQQYEQQLQNKILKLLEPIYGAGKVNVSINADLDFDAIERKTVKYADPKIRSENVQASGSGENIQNAQTNTVTDNVSNVTGNTGDGENNSYSRTVNNELNTETTTVVNAPGSVKRLTTSVVIDGNLSNNVQREVRVLVSSAIGFDEDRGDVISIQGMDFKATQGDSDKITDQLTDLAKKRTFIYVGAGLSIFIILLIIGLVLFFARRRRRKQEEEDYDVDISLDEEEQEVRETSKDKGSIIDISSDDFNMEDLEELIKTKDKRNEKATKYAEHDPQAVADLIKAWTKQK